MAAHKNKRKKLLIFSLVTTILIILTYVMGIDAYNAKNTVPKIPRLVKVIKVQGADASDSRSFPGIVQANYETDLAFRVGGPLVNVNVKTGQNVAPGDIIAQIDPRDYLINVKRLEASISQAEANLQAMQRGARKEDIARMSAELGAARAQLEEAKSNYARFASLYKEKAVAKATFESAKTAHENALARVTSAAQALEIGKSGARKEDLDAMGARIRLLKTDLEAAKNALADTQLRAPIHGLVNKKYVDNYETVAPGQAIVSLMDLSSVEVKTGIPQCLVTRLAQCTDFSVALDTYPGLVIPARIKEVGQKTEGPGMGYPLVVRMDLPANMLVLPGMAAEITIAVSQSKNNNADFVLPNAAIFADRQGRSNVWTIDNATMTVQKTPVTLGAMVEKGVLVTAGLKTGDMVVGAGARLLMAGEKVRLADEAPEHRQ